MLCLLLQIQPSDTKVAKSISDVMAAKSLESKLFHFVDILKKEVLNCSCNALTIRSSSLSTSCAVIR